MFNVDFTLLIRWFTPKFLRDAFTLAFLKALSSPVIELYGEFTTFRTNALYQLNHDSRVFSIRAVLNDRFDNTSRRIYITKGLNKDRVPIYLPIENKPVTLGTMVLYNPADYSDTGVDFIVWVPNVITMTTQDLVELTSLVNKYCLPDKQFSIKRV